MTQPIPGPLPPPTHGAIHGAASSAAPARPPDRDGPAAGAPAFQALLEDLESRARSLERTSRGELTPDALAGAVDEARVSLETMLSLKDRLLEAWLASRQPEPPAPDVIG